MSAKDLRVEYPRSPYDELGGMPWLARLVDKVRAKHAGTLGEYVPYPCGGDTRFLTTYGLEAEPLEELIASGADDPQVASWCREHAKNNLDEGRARLLDAYRAPIAPERKSILEEMIANLSKQRPDLDLSNIVNATQLILLEEGHLVPAEV